MTISVGSTRLTFNSLYTSMFDVFVEVARSAGNLVVGSDGNDYYCILSHTSEEDNDKPITGTNWSTYWAATGSSGTGVAWQDAKAYTHARMWKNGSTYIMKNATGQSYTQIYASGGGKGIDTRGDDPYTVEWDGWNLSNYGLMFYAGSVWKLGAGQVYACNIARNTREFYIYLRGYTQFVGTEGNEVILKNYTRLYFYADDGADWTYVKLQDNYNSTKYYIYRNLYSLDKEGAVNWDHVTIEDTVSATGSGLGYAIYCAYGGKPWSKWNINHLTINNTNVGVLDYGCGLKIINGSFNNTVSYAYYAYGSGNVVGNNYQTSKDDTVWGQGVIQPAGVFENVTFTDCDLGVYSVYATGGATAVIKDCTFVGEVYSGSQRAINSRGGSRILMVGDNTYVNCRATPRSWGTQGTYLYGYELDLTAQSIDGAPVENAVVMVRQVGNKEFLTAKTDVKGTVKTLWGGLPVFVEKEETSNGVFIDWSNSLVDNYHIITVAKEGYDTNSQHILFNENKEVIVVLTEPYTKLTGVISEDNLSGSISNPSLSGVVVTDSLTGVVSEE